MIYLACENIRFSSLFAAGDETSYPSKHSEKKGQKAYQESCWVDANTVHNATIWSSFVNMEM